MPAGEVLSERGNRGRKISRLAAAVCPLETGTRGRGLSDCSHRVKRHPRNGEARQRRRDPVLLPMNIAFAYADTADAANPMSQARWKKGDHNGRHEFLCHGYSNSESLDARSLHRIVIFHLATHWFPNWYRYWREHEKGSTMLR